MPTSKLNCWQYKRCGREPGGRRSNELGVCPAAADQSFDGINDGRCAGRFCWAVAGTFCGGTIQGTYAEKRDSCLSCDFFQRIQAEEGAANLHTKFLRFITNNPGSVLVKGLRSRYVRAGERFIRQGEPADYAYIIQRGSAIVLVEKDGELHPVGHRGEGDIVGVMAILTGEPRGAHVEAETPMELWVLDKRRFDNLSREDPELLRFLTELVADRFDSKRPIADRLIGKYLATELIGRGGYSLVYRGLHTGLNRPVVIKMLKHHLALESDFLTAFRNEASIIARLNHENIVRVHDIEERFRTIFIVMEYVEGRRLSEVLEKDGPLTVDRALPILVQLCRGLGYAHQLGIVHQDITPDNIFVMPDGRVKILDFGLACFSGAENYLAGTPYYMAPEQVECLPVDSRTDIYSLGITAYKMLTGTLPFPEEAGWKVMERHVHEDIPDPIASAPHLPAGLRAFIIKACQRDSSRRYASANDALAALLPLADTAAAGASEPDFDSPAKASHYILRHRGKHLAALNRLMAAFNRLAAAYGASLEPAPRSDSSEAPRDGRDLKENR